MPKGIRPTAYIESNSKIKLAKAEHDILLRAASGTTFKEIVFNRKSSKQAVNAALRRVKARTGIGSTLKLMYQLGINRQFEDDEAAGGTSC